MQEVGETSVRDQVLAYTSESHNFRRSLLLTTCSYCITIPMNSLRILISVMLCKYATQ